MVRCFLCLMTLILAIGGVFGRVTSHGYVNWDDYGIFPESLPNHGLTTEGLRWAFSSSGGEWQPLAHLIHMIQAEIWGDTAQGVHLTSLVIHMLNAILLWVVVLKLLQICFVNLGGRRSHTAVDPISVTLAVALVMLHPLRAEPVAWAAGQATLWCGTFALLSVVSLLNLIETRSPKRWFFAASTTGSILAGFLVKPVMAPAVIWLSLLLIWSRLRTREAPVSRRRDLTSQSEDLDAAKRFMGIARGDRPQRMGFLVYATVGLAWAIAVGTVGISLIMRHRFQDVASVHLLEWGTLVPRAGYALGLYMQKTLLPLSLSPFYGMPTEASVWMLYLAASVLVLIFLFCLLRRNIEAIFLILAVFAGLAPALGWIKLGRFVAADRYTYMGSLALAPLLAGIFMSLRAKQTLLVGRIVLVSALLTIMGFSALSYDQVRIWHDSKTLWSHALNHGGDVFADVHSNLGGALESSGAYQEALGSYEKAIALDPLYPDAHLGRGVTLYRLGRVDEAITEAEVATKIGGDYALAWQNLAAFYFNQRNMPQARRTLEKAISLAPSSPQLLYLSGQLKADAGQFVSAMTDFALASKLKPDWPEPLIALGALYAILGKKAEALELLERVIRDHPTSTAARTTLNQVIMIPPKSHVVVP
jgi:tetratricopeptide (TPR) repeat protein